MKTYTQFLDEALLSSLVKATARSVVRNRAVIRQATKPSTVTRRITKPREISGFQTARGSKYTYKPQPKSWPQTQRTAPNDPYHSTSAGTKQKSDWTLFTTPDASMTMRQRFMSGTSDGKFYQGLPQSPTPRRGRAPVEVWNKYAEKGGKAAIHPGSPITDIQTKTRGSGIGLYGAQRKELQQRVTTALKKPRNVDVLKKELEMKLKQKNTTYRNLGIGRKEEL
jgi:hypothetical protein